MDDDLLELETRRRVFMAVRGSPGIHISEVARDAGIGSTHARYHLSQLVRAGMILEESDEGFVRYYPLGETRGMVHSLLGRKEKDLIQALRRPRALHIAAALAVHGDMTLARLAQHVGKSRPAVSFHLDRLVERGVVRRMGGSPADRVYGLVDATEVVRLLTLYPPRPGVVASFMALWEGLAIPMPGLPPPGPSRPPGSPAAKADRPRDRDEKPAGGPRLKAVWELLVSVAGRAATRFARLASMSDRTLRRA